MVNDMKCPVCENEVQGSICEYCGYNLDNDLLYNKHINQLSKEEIDQYQDMIKRYKNNYQQKSNKHNEFIINEMLELASKYKKKRYTIDIEKSIYFYEKAEMLGSVKASEELGNLYYKIRDYKGNKYEEEYVDKAITHYLIAYSRGSIVALDALVDIYRDRGELTKAENLLGQIQQYSGNENVIDEHFLDDLIDIDDLFK